MLDLKPHLIPSLHCDDARRLAHGQFCTLRIASFVPGLRCSHVSTTVGAHLPVDGKSMGDKVTDLALGFACEECHAILDRRNMAAWKYLMEHYPTAVLQQALKSNVMTNTILLEEGVLTCPTGELTYSGTWR